MAYRVFTDADGRTWTAWAVLPPPRQQSRRTGSESLSPRIADVGPRYARGWLAFASAAERRRLAPIPVGWEKMTDVALDGLCEAATPRRQSRRDKFRNESWQENDSVDA